MKIAILSPFYPLRGGIAQFADHLALELEKNHSVKTFSFKRQYPKILFPGKTQLVENMIESKVKALPILDSINPLSYFRTAKKIKEFEPDVVIVAYWMSFMAPSTGMVCYLLKKRFKTVALVHNFIPHEAAFYDKFLGKYFLKQQKGIVTLSQTVENQIKNIRPELKTIALSHPNYTEFGEKKDREEARSKLDISPDKKVLLFFGLIRDYKGLDSLLRVFKDLDESFHLIVAGEAYSSFEPYQKLIDEFPFQNITILNRFFADEELPDIFSSANLCVLPYKTATQSGVTAVANHFELPVLATNVGGLHEMIKNGENGILVEPNSDKLLITGIRNYFENQLEEKFRNKLKAEALENSWSNFCEGVVQFVEKL